MDPSNEGVDNLHMPKSATASDAEITERQRQIVALLAAGCSNVELGARLGISPRTAKAHCDALRAKLGVSRRRHIPVAYRAQTGRDPYEVPLGGLRPGQG